MVVWVDSQELVQVAAAEEEEGASGHRQAPLVLLPTISSALGRLVSSHKQLRIHLQHSVDWEAWVVPEAQVKVGNKEEPAADLGLCSIHSCEFFSTRSLLPPALLRLTIIAIFRRFTAACNKFSEEGVAAALAVWEVWEVWVVWAATHSLLSEEVVAHSAVKDLVGALHLEIAVHPRNASRLSCSHCRTWASSMVRPIYVHC